MELRPEDFEGLLPDEISSLRALGVPTFEMAHWAVLRAGWAARVTVQALQARVDEKRKRLPKYQETVKENWLVIVADATKPSGLFDERSEFDARGISSPFSKTFLYGYPNRLLVELGGQHSDVRFPFR
jgi:hypothetical protein